MVGFIVRLCDDGVGIVFEAFISTGVIRCNDVVRAFDILDYIVIFL